MNATVSLDTIRLGNHLPLPDETWLHQNGWTPLHNSRDGRRYKWIKNQPDDDCERHPRLTWSAPETGADWLSAEVSLPTMIKGSNAFSLTGQESLAGLDAMSAFISDHAKQDFDARAAKVSRLDFAANWKVGDEATMDYIIATRRANIPRHKKKATEETTVSFENKGRKVQLYSKYRDVFDKIPSAKPSLRESALRESAGVLRLEVELKRRPSVRSIGRKNGYPDASADEMVGNRIGVALLNKAMGEIGLGELHPARSVIDVLHEHFGGGRRLRDLVAMHHYFEQYGHNFWKIPKLGVARASYYKAMRALKDAGVLLDAPHNRALPPLRLVASSETNIIQPYA